jgi:hypothetical protein
MANGADTLRSINAILQSGERKEQRKVDTALAMMQLAASQESSKAREAMALQQFAQTTRMQEIALTQNNLQTSLKLLESQKPKIASSFVQSSGLSRYYQEIEEGEMADDAITDMAKALSKQMGKGYSDQASQFAGALFNYYTAKDSESMLNIASSLHDATQAINADTATGQQRELFEAFHKLGATADLQGVSELAKKAKISEANISKEYSEFLQGDYDIQSPIGIYADIPETIMATAPPAGTILTPNAVSIDETREALKLSQIKLQSLEQKMDAGVATDEEKEEYYALPSSIKRLRIDLYDQTGEFEEEMDEKIESDEEKIDAYRRAGLSGMPEFIKLKQKLTEQKIQRNQAILGMRQEQEQEGIDEQLERTSELTGISVKDIKEYQEMREGRRVSSSGRMR